MNKESKYFLVIFFDEPLTKEITRWNKYFYYNKEIMNPYPVKKPCLILGAYDETLNIKQMQLDCKHLFIKVPSFELTAKYISVDPKKQNIFLDLFQNNNLVDFHRYYMLALRDYNFSMDEDYLPINYYPIIIMTKIYNQEKLISTWANICRSRIANKYQPITIETLEVALITIDNETIFSFPFERKLVEEQ